MRIAVLTPTTGACRSTYTYSLANMLMYVAFNGVCGKPIADIQFRMLEGSSGISSNRENMARQAVKDGFTHILFIDEDQLFPHNGLDGLARHDLPIVGTNYRMRAPKADFTAILPDGSGRIQTTEESTGLEECAYCGFGFCLIKAEVFEAFGERPMFLTGYIPDEHRYTTEDWSYFSEAKKLGYTCYIDQDVSKAIAHVGNFTYHWSDKWPD